MATKKRKSKGIYGIALEVDGEVLGKFKSVKAAETEEVQDYVPSHRPSLPTEVTLAIPEAIRDLWSDANLFHASGECALGRPLPKGPVHPDADLIIKTQLEMWGMDKGEVPVPMDCVVKFVQLIEDLGYSASAISLSGEASLSTHQMYVTQPFEFHYVSRGNDEL